MKATKKITLKDYYENCGVYINITELERVFCMVTSGNDDTGKIIIWNIKA